MKFILLCSFVTLAVASLNHQIILLKSENPTTEYREEDSKGFYSYGYSSDDSAKAEYKTLDGSSKGFYSYIDSEGKLQTVKYEAGRNQGFTASATNLPTAPVDNSIAPEQVTDTPEVEMAKQAHFEAYREAAIQAAMQPDNGDDDNTNAEEASANAEELTVASNDSNDAENSNGSNGLTAASEVSESNGSTTSSESTLSNEQITQLESELQQNTRQMVMEHQNSHEQLLDVLRDQQQQQQLASQEIHSGESSAQQQQTTQNAPLMTTYVLNAENHLEQPQLSELQTVYRLDSSDSNVELKLGGLNLDAIQQRSLDLLQHQQEHLTAHASPLSTEETLGSIETIRVPSNSYYTVNSPTTHYTVETPTVLTTLPRLVAVNFDKHHLPISVSTAFSSQRLSSKSTSH